MPVAAARELDTEQSAVERARAGDRLAFDWLVRTQGAWVRGLLFGVLGDVHSAEDLAQVVWARAWAELGSLNDASRWRPWLARLAKNAAIDNSRQRQRERAGLSQLQQDNGRDRRLHRRPGRDSAERREQHETVMSAIRGLPPIYREPFVLRQLHEFSYQQIAELLDLPPATVETRLTRARRLLREALADRL